MQNLEMPPPATFRAMVFIFSVTIVLTIGFDIWAWNVYGRHATISHGICWVAHQWPIMVLVVGVFIGHLFW